MDPKAVVRVEFIVSHTHVVEMTVAEWEQMVAEESGLDMSAADVAADNGFEAGGNAADYVFALAAGIAADFQGESAMVALGEREGIDSTEISVESADLL